ncbi:MAG: DUF3857 domain-containing protein [Balneola sp.]|nr:MAG: DUF3857 domain-containing protein [Balneola sp.]
MYRLLLTSLFLLYVTNLYSQTFKFGDIPQEHLEMEVYDKDSTASAVILFSNGETDLTYRNEEFMLTIKRHVRIKILTDEGLDEGDISIRFRNKNSSSPEEINNIKATSYFLDENGKLNKENIGRRDRFTEELSEYASAVKFTMPNLRKGSVFEYSYELVSNNPLNFPDWVFQGDIPVMWSEYTAKIPEWFSFLTVSRGFHRYAVNEQKTYNDYFSLRSIYMGDTSERIEFKGTEYRYAMKDLPAIKSEPYMKTSLDYLSHIRYKLASIQMPNSMVDNYMTSWRGLVNGMLENGDYGRRLNGRWVGREVAGLVDDADSDLHKMVKVYNHVSSVMDWNENYGLWPNKKLEDVYEEGTGNGAAINLVLVDFLRAVGLEAHPVMISTRSHGEVIRTFPGSIQFNHTIVYAEVDGIYHLLDAKDDYLPYNLLHPEDLNGEGLLVYPNEELWVPIDNKSTSSEVCRVNVQITDSGIKGSLKLTNKGYFAYNRRQQIDYEELEKSVKQEILGAPDSYMIDSVSISKDVLDESFDLEVDFRIDKNMHVDVLYINPMVIGGRENPFKKEDRSFPVDYNYPFSENLVYSMTLPEGWVVDELPQSVVHRLPDNTAEFRRLIQANGNTIMMNYIFRIKKYRFMPGEYDELKKMYDQMTAMLDANIVLKKQTNE